MPILNEGARDILASLADHMQYSLDRQGYKPKEATCPWAEDPTRERLKEWMAAIQKAIACPHCQRTRGHYDNCGLGD